MSGDDPIDLGQVSADDAALEALVAGRVPDDLALLLLHVLRADVAADPEPVPLGVGSTVLTLADDRSPDRRVRNGTLVAAMTAGLLSLSGVAAASTMAPDGSPLSDIGDAVRSVVGAAVGAVTPPEAEPAPAAPLESPSPRATAPGRVGSPPAGAEVSAVARSQAAARQVAALLDAAQALLREGRTDAASARLDTAERRLADVLPADAAPLTARLADLREQVAAAGAPARKPAAPDKPAAPQQAPQEPAPREQAPKEPPAKDPDPKAEQGKEQPRGGRQPAQREPSPRGSARTSEPSAPQLPGEAGRQVSKDASTKPRA